MQIRPSVVLGVGSSGAFVLSGLEKFLYELLGTTPTELFRLITIETERGAKPDEPPPGGPRGQLTSIYEPNTGQVIKNLRENLKHHLDWLGSNHLEISGPGAGNIRAAGRLLFFNKFPELEKLLERATIDVEQQAKLPKVADPLKRELSRRGIEPNADLISTDAAVYYTVGTLTGGTCSGCLIDLGYAIREIAPKSPRVGIFFLPTANASAQHQANTWAALQDLLYFTESPEAYDAVRPKTTHDHRSYQGAKDKGPFDQIFLVSTRDESGQLKLEYDRNVNAPLFGMVSLFLAADLLGLHSLRMARFSDLGAHVSGVRNQVFLNLNVRAVSYPKYEIAETAACRVIAEQICAGWLSDTSQSSPAGTTEIKEEDTRADGRAWWRDGFGRVWEGTAGGVDLDQLANKLLTGTFADPVGHLRHQFAGNAPDTIYAQVVQHQPSRLEALKRLALDGIGSKLASGQNIQAGTLFLQGIRQEAQLTLAYWDAIGIPDVEDQSAWQTQVKNQADKAIAASKPPFLWFLGVREDVLRDGLKELLTRLQMVLMRKPVKEFTTWLNSVLAKRLELARGSLEQIKGLAQNRQSTLSHRLSESRPPILRLSRSSKEGFQEEVQSLLLVSPKLKTPIFRVTAGTFEGLLGELLNSGLGIDDNEIFLTMKSEIQPILLLKLEEKGPVDIVNEIRSQNRAPQAAALLREARALSVATETFLYKEQGCSSFVAAKTPSTAKQLLEELRKVDNTLPEMQETALPLFDHMAIFYQEGAALDPGKLRDAQSFRSSFEAVINDPNKIPNQIDPLRGLRGSESPVGGS